MFPGGERGMRGTFRGETACEAESKPSSGRGPSNELLSGQRNSETRSGPASSALSRQMEILKRGSSKRTDFYMGRFFGYGKPPPPIAGKRETARGVSSKS